MAAVRVVCDRCGYTVEGLRGPETTAGFYRVNIGTWEKYGAPGEVYLCDACMRSDWRYCYDYGISQLEGQVLFLQRRWPQATYEPAVMHHHPSGVACEALLVVPDLPLPDGWNKGKSTVRFWLPVNFPYTTPFDFWCDEDLRLSSGGVPSLACVLDAPWGGRGLWFRHSLRTWRGGYGPGRNTITTYFHTIRLRLETAR